MLNTVITTIKKYLGISNYVREETKRPLEQESENECEEDIFHYTQPQKKKKCSDGDHHLTSSNDAPDLSPVLMRFPWFTERKEENKSSDVKMSSRKSQQQKEGCDAEVTIVEERVKKWSSPFPCSTSVLVSGTAEPENDFEALEKREARNVGEQTSCCHHPTQSSFADLHFAPSISESVQSDFHAKQKSRNFDCSSRSRNHKSRMKKSGFKGPLTTVLDRPLGRKKSLSFLSSRIKWSLVHKSFLHEEKRKYRQLLQQYTDHYLIPNSKVLSHKVSRSSLFTSSNPGAGMLHTASNASFTRSDATATAASYSVPSSPVGMVTRSHWTPFLTKKKQEQIESITGSSTPRLLPSTDSTTFEEVMGSRKVISLDENVGKYKKQEKSSSIYVPLVDLSKDDNEEQSTSDRESDGDSVIMIKEMLSPQAQRNSLEDRLKEHPLYDLEWVKTMRKEYEDRAYIAQKNADTTSELIQELQQRRNKKSSLQEKVTQGLKLLDLTYPSKYTEVQLPDEEEEVLVPLTPEMENEIDDALNRTPQSEVLIEKFHIQITRRDIKTLNGLNWLNDEVINFYMNLLMERSEKKDKYPRVYAFNTFFYSKLSKSGYHSVRRWTKKVDLFSYDMLLVPIHLGMHWCMAVVDFKTKCISYYDSMLHSNEWCLESLLEYLKAEHQDKKGSSYDTDVWKLQNKKNIPQQMNGSDCGMFACKFADYLSRRAKINFDQEHMPYFRRRMVYEIINAKLL